MCESSRFMMIPCTRLFPGRRHNRPLHPFRIHRLIRRRRIAKDERNTKGVEIEMEMKNLKLYMENQSIIEENEKLRKKAFLLHKENQVLLSQLQIVSNQKKQPPI